MATPLPTTRQFLTSLINTLITSTAAPPPPNIHNQPPQQPQINSHNLPSNPADIANAENPLKFISQQQKALLATMHVLFPPPMLLQALDLLDRGLVVRVVEREVGDGVDRAGDESGNREGQVGGRGAESVDLGRGGESEVGESRGEEGERTVWPPQANIHLPSSPSRQSSPPWPPSPTSRPSPPASKPNKRKRKRNQIHQVRSSQAPKSRFSHSQSTSISNTGAVSGLRPGSSSGGMGGGGPGTIYTVRLLVWSCSCAAFAYSCFPASHSTFNAPWHQPPSDRGPESDVKMGGEREMERGREDQHEGRVWEFGGLSLTGNEAGESVPVCKHLLACLLGERWGDVLGRYVREREVSREEMAGLGGEG